MTVLLLPIPYRIIASSHPFVDAGSTQAAKEPVDHLDGTEDELQTAGGQQRSEQSNVELHNVLGLYAGFPPRIISQVTPVTMWGRKRKGYERSGLWKTFGIAFRKLLLCVTCL